MYAWLNTFKCHYIILRQHLMTLFLVCTAQIPCLNKFNYENNNTFFLWSKKALQTSVGPRHVPSMALGNLGRTVNDFLFANYWLLFLALYSMFCLETNFAFYCFSFLLVQIFGINCFLYKFIKKLNKSNTRKRYLTQSEIMKTRGKCSGFLEKSLVFT